MWTLVRPRSWPGAGCQGVDLLMAPVESGSILVLLGAVPLLKYCVDYRVDYGSFFAVESLSSRFVTYSIHNRGDVRVTG